MQASASTPNAPSTLARALSDGARQKSMTLYLSSSRGGAMMRYEAKFSSSVYSGTTTTPGLGTNYIVGQRGADYVFVKVSSLAALKTFHHVHAPAPDEIGVWYKERTSDPLYSLIAMTGDPETIAPLFSFDHPANPVTHERVNWGRAATYEGTTVLRGVRVIKPGVESQRCGTARGPGATTLYVTSSARPLPFAMTCPSVGIYNFIYYGEWNTTKVVIPTTKAIRP